MKAELINIREIARLIFLEGIRRHTLLGLAILAVAAEAGGLLFMDFFGRDLGNPVNDFIFSVLWFVGFVFVFFHAVPIMAWDVERGFIYPLLARPVSRTNYVIGVFAGLAALLISLELLLGALGLATLMWIQGSLDPIYFPELSVTHFISALFAMLAYLHLLIAVVMLLSSAIRGAFPVLMLTMAYYGIASGLPIVRNMSDGTAHGANSLQYLLTLLAAIFPDPSTYDTKAGALSVAALQPLSEVAVSFGSALLYIGIVLWLACFLYGRRDLS